MPQQVPQAAAVGGRMRAQEELVAAPPGRERLAQQAVQEAAVGVSPAARALVAELPARELLATPPE